MDLSSLISQAEMSSSKMNFYKANKNNKNSKPLQQLFIAVFEENLDRIVSFLTWKEQHSLKLLCRGVGYLFVVKDLWGSMKINVADKKLQDADDYDFIEQEPKQISKQDKKIRIHSLRKNLGNSLSKKPKRQSSNIKQKTLTMSIIQTQLNPFQKTQLGFKRLLKANNPSLIKTSTKPKQQINIDIEQNMSIERLAQLLEIPADYSIDDLIINPKDQWVKNMHRANNLISVVKRWNSYHQRFWNFVSKQETELIILMKKMIKIDGGLMSYRIIMEEEPHSTILSIIKESAPKNALIQQQLNKLGKQFIQLHRVLSELIEKKQTQQIIKTLHQCYQKISQKLNKPVLQAPVWAEGLSIFDQAYDSVVSKLTSEKLKASLLKSVTNVFKQLIDQHLLRAICFEQGKQVSLKKTQLKFIIENSQFCQLIFQILYNLVVKLTNQNNGEKQSSKILGFFSSLKQNEQSTVFTKKLKLKGQIQPLQSKLKGSQNKQTSNRSQKILFGILWNISKYFDKLQKQTAAKEMKKKDDHQVLLIKNFIQTQSKVFDKQIHLISSQSNSEAYSKGLTDLEEYYKTFKSKIQKLKDQIAKTSGKQSK